MLIVDNLEHETEQRETNLVKVLEVKAHVEGFDVGQILQEVEVAFKCGILERY